MLSRRVYFGLAALGGVIPYTALGLFISRNGLDPVQLTQQALGSPGAVFFTLDVIVCAVTVMISVLRDTRDRRIRAVVLAATVLVGPSCGLPLWLGLRQAIHRTERRTSGP